MATAEIQLTHQEQHALHALAQRTGKTPDTLLHEVVMQLLSQAQHEDQLGCCNKHAGCGKTERISPM